MMELQEVLVAASFFKFVALRPVRLTDHNILTTEFVPQKDATEALEFSPCEP